VVLPRTAGRGFWRPRPSKSPLGAVTIGGDVAVELVGRDDEVAALHAFFDQGERPVALVLEGEAGIGKTTLWSAGVEAARERGFRVLASRPVEAERGLAFAVLGDLFEDLPTELIDELPDPRRRALEVALLIEDAGAEPLDPLAVRVAARTLLQRLSQRQSVVVAIDDVQWVDAASTAVLEFALRRLDADDVLVLLARRSDADAAGTGLVPAFAARLDVGPLSVGALHRLLVDRLARPFSRHTLLRLHATSGGNPFYALELARVLAESTMLPDPAEPLPVPETLHELVRDRLAALPQDTQAALLAVSALANPTMHDVRQVFPDASSVLAPAVRAGVIEVAGEAVRFTHPLLDSVLYTEAGHDARCRMHGLLAEGVDDPVERARDVSLAVEQPDDATAQQLEDASRLASVRGAPAVAAGLAERAARLTPPAFEDERQRRLLAAASACLAAGDVPRAGALGREVLAAVPAGAQRAEALRLLHEVCDHSGETHEAIRLLHEALPHAAERPDLQAEIHTDLATGVRLTEGLRVAACHAQSAVELADRVGDPALRAEARSVLALVRFNAAQPGALELAENAYTLATSARKPFAALWGLTHILVWTGRFDRARELLQAAREELKDRDEKAAASALWYLSFVELRSGRWLWASDYAATALDVELQYSPDGRPPPSVLIPCAMIAGHRGDLERARAIVLEGRELAAGHPAFLLQYDGILGWIELWDGNAEAAATRFAAAEQAGREAELIEPIFFDWRGDEIECLTQLGRLDEATELLDAWEATATRVGRDWVLAMATRCRGFLAAANGQVEPALERFEEAVSRHEAAGDAFGRARASLALGVTRRRTRQKRAAREAIETALRGFEELGAAGWAEKARGELGRIGGRTQVDGLTPAELRVATLVAEGRSNKEVAAALFLGERTVETHLTHIYAKLVVRSRAELARTLR
jgi:DNA-binding CsgD family transcriptional regulator